MMLSWYTPWLVRSLLILSIPINIIFDQASVPSIYAPRFGKGESTSLSDVVVWMVCHRRFHKEDQKVTVQVKPASSGITSSTHLNPSFDYFTASFRPGICNKIIEAATSHSLSVTRYGTRHYKMTDDRGLFWELLIALFRKIEAGMVRTEHVYKHFRYHSIYKM